MVRARRSPTDKANDEMFTYMRHIQMNELKDYLDRGRRFGGAVTSELNEKWIFAFRRFVASEAKMETREMEDVSAELRLRGLDVPYEAVKKERTALNALVRHFGPIQSETSNESFEAFRAERRKPPH
jgi:hypothetical protein